MIESTELAQVACDYRWMLQSASLIGECPALLPAGREAVLSDSELLTALQNWPSTTKPRFVGKYFEQLIEFHLRGVLGVDLVATGEQVFRDGVTVGELDFVFRDAAGLLQHWETAVKFYLFTDEDPRRGSRLIGPNPRDSFEQKLNRLTTHQLPLGRSVCPGLAAQAAIVRGFIFYPPNAEVPLSALPLELSPNHLRGIWLRSDKWNTIDSVFGHETQFCVMRKPHWLAAPQTAERLLPKEMSTQVLRHFSQSTRPLMISAGVARGDRWDEQQRLMVVDAGWPGRATE